MPTKVGYDAATKSAVINAVLDARSSKLGRNPRFIPDDLRLWAAQGFPPASTFKQWKEADERRRRRSG